MITSNRRQLSKTLALFDKAPTIEEQAHYIFPLRNVKSGWTLEQRTQYFAWFTKARVSGKPALHSPELVQWFKEVERDYSDGASYPKFLVNLRKDALSTLTSAERTALQPVIEEYLNTSPWKPTMERMFVKEWTASDLEARLGEVGSGRDFKSGQNAFRSSRTAPNSRRPTSNPGKPRSSRPCPKAWRAC